MTRLSVNINKIAVLRNSRGGNIPNLLSVSDDIERFGAEGITVHPRPDERHIRFKDVTDLKKRVKTEFNIEGYPTDHFMEMVLEVNPDQVTLVPDPPGALTSDAGWDTVENGRYLFAVIEKFKAAGIRTSIFVDTNLKNIEGAQNTGTDRIEFYTGPYAANFEKDKEAAIKEFIVAAEKANELNLGINAGHDLNLNNLKYFKENIPGLLEVSIGHALISDSLYYGFQNTVQMYLRLLN
ncbi:MAG: pyridoxine 5'-phosphate synthase [Flavobacteriales bacterium]|nr:pyridoxine 5'-phosphate synthase [Flavobacteriales bacterium]